MRYHPLKLRIGELTPVEQAQTEQASKEGFLEAFKQITPSLIVVGIVTGATIAIGSALVERYLLPRLPTGRR